MVCISTHCVRVCVCLQLALKSLTCILEPTNSISRKFIPSKIDSSKTIMERKDKAPKRKRITTRDEADHDQKKECRNRGKKKPEIITCGNNLDKDSSYREKGSDPIGVFDFPWLKEGSCFQVDEFLKPDEDIFAPCSYIDEVQQEIYVANLDQTCVQNSLVPPDLDKKIHDNKLDADSLCSFRADDLEPFDCIWRSVLDQPLL